jgi:putative tributyrin esterase
MINWKKFMKNKQMTFVFWLILLLILPTAVQAQKTETSKTAVQDLKLNSKLMAREMPYKVILPLKYEADKTKRFAVIYLLHGLEGHYDNWVTKSKLAEHAAKYEYIIVTPEGNNGWYTDSATLKNDKYESYIIKELVPEIDKKFRTLADRQNRTIAGLSMGGYGALKFGLKYPQMFALVGSFSGALPAPLWTNATLGGLSRWKTLTDSLTAAYGADDSPTRRENDIFRIVGEMPADKIKSLPFIYLDCGTEDFLIRFNRDFATILFDKKIPHEFRQLPGVHDWKFWDSQVQEFLQLKWKSEKMKK